MKPRFTFQTLILVVLAPVLAGLTAIWAWQLYRSTHRAILDGFDRKLLAVAGSVSTLIDADEHRAYQQRHSVVALAPHLSAGLVGFTAERHALVAIAPATGGAKPLATFADLRLRSLASLPDARLFGLSDDGATIAELDGTHGTIVRTVHPAQPLDGLFCFDGQLAGWRARAVFALDPATGAADRLASDLPQPLRSIAHDAVTHRYFGLSEDGGELLTFTLPGGAARRVRLVTAASEATDGRAPVSAALAACAWQGGQLYGAGPSLVTIDADSGQVTSGSFTSGYFDVEHPFYVAHRRALGLLQQAAGLTYLYTQVYLGGSRIYYVLDGTTTTDYSPPGSSDELPPVTNEGAERVQFLGQSWSSPIQRWAAWGLLKSGFTPVRDSSGNVIAIAGADVDITVIRAKSRWALFAAIFIGVGSVAAAGLVSFRVARSLTRPLEQLKESALWIAAGDYGVEIKSGGTREVSALAETLDQLRRRLQDEGAQARTWHDTVRAQRECTALAHTLDEIMVGLSGRDDGADSIYRRGADLVWWHAPAVDDPVSAACARARLALLAGELLRAGHRPGELPELLLASSPDLVAAACWDERSHTLHHCTRRPVTVLLDGAAHRLEAAGQQRFTQCDTLRWLDDGPAGVGAKPADLKGPA